MQAIERFWITSLMRESTWLYPAIETIHLLGMAVLFGSIVLVDLRLMGIGRDIDPQRLFRFAIPLTLAGFLLAGASGFMLFLTEASTFIASRLFVLKISLIFMLVCNAASVHLRIKQDIRPYRDGGDEFPPLIRLQAVLSMLGWAAVLAMGRWLAYL